MCRAFFPPSLPPLVYNLFKCPFSFETLPLYYTWIFPSQLGRHLDGPCFLSWDAGVALNSELPFLLAVEVSLWD